MNKKNIIQEKTFDFALKIIQIVKRLEKEHKEYVLSKQLMRSGTSVGALVWEAEHAESKKDFIHKMSISLKEANETRYWLDLLHESNFLDNVGYKTVNDSITQIIRILVSIVKPSKLKS